MGKEGKKEGKARNVEIPTCSGIATNLPAHWQGFEPAQFAALDADVAANF